MNPLDRWLSFVALRRERWLALGRFVWQRFVADRCFESAGALSYTTIFALVPLTTAIFGIIAAFPVFEEWSREVTRFVFANFVPTAGEVVQGYLTQFADNATKLTSAGVIALIASALLMMHSVEETFNRIWRVPPRRRRMARFVVYWTTLTLGPLLIAASLALSSFVFSLPVFAGEGLRLHDRFFSLLPFAVTWSALTLAYLVIPNAVVRFRHAALGAVFATLLFEWAKWFFAGFLGNANYTQIYGALAALPIFLLWVYVSWVVVLLGASLTASHTAFRFQPEALRVPPGLEFVAMLRTYRRIVEGARLGRPPSRAELLARDPGLSDAQLDRFLTEMRAARLVQRGESGEWVPLRDPATVNLRELFEAGAHRWPTERDLARLAESGAPEDAAIRRWIVAGHTALSAALAAPLSEMLSEPVPDGAVVRETEGAR